jgi:hypothetical protein
MLYANQSGLLKKLLNGLFQSPQDTLVRFHLIEQVHMAPHNPYSAVVNILEQQV